MATIAPDSPEQDLRSPLARARDEFLEGDGKSLLDPRTLGNSRADVYLRNRIEAAFLAGANWAARHLADRYDGRDAL